MIVWPLGQYLLKLGEPLQPPAASAPEQPVEEAVDLHRELLLADAETLRHVAEHDLALATESHRVELLAQELRELHQVVGAQERELLERRAQRGETLNRYRRAKQREAWMVAAAQVQQQQAEAWKPAVLRPFA